ncbi:MAG: hypothetical protein ACMXYL_00015 [Candidatus Woesearchaeota archaeon]
MKIKKGLFLTALLITLFLLSTILLIGSLLSDKREETIREQMHELQESIREIQTFFLMSEVWGPEMACLAFRERVTEMDKTIWSLGQRIDQYRIASEEFFRDPYYFEQKRIFNEHQLVYLTLLTKLKQECGYDQVIISFFFQYETECPRCDDQSFILSDINRELGEEVSIFSFDTGLGIKGIELLADYYDIDELPCIVIEETTYCGLRSKRFIMERICEAAPHIRASCIIEE